MRFLLNYCSLLVLLLLVFSGSCYCQPRFLVSVGGIISTSNFKMLNMYKTSSGWTVGLKYHPIKHWYTSLSFDKISFSYDRVEVLSESELGYGAHLQYAGDSAIDLLGL